jgi:23S rRNA (pseudouridine1915-N3)-methyltransferase
MRLRLIWIGKTKNVHIRGLFDDYLSRLENFTRCEITELRESGSRTEYKVLEEDSRNIVGAIRSDSPAVLLDVKGESWSSTELAQKLERWQVQGTKELTFIIGGHYGVLPNVKQLVTNSWSLSRLTFTHDMVRVLLIEQLYRAYTIIQGLPYHK